MKKTTLLSAILICIIHASVGQQAAFYESFDTGAVEGVKRRAQLFDGFFTERLIAASSVPQSENFTIEAWIAVQEYAANIAAIADKENSFKSGYLFGINQYGRLVAGFAIYDKWLTLSSDEVVPLLKWTHVAMTVENGKTVSLYINGKSSGTTHLTGNISFCDTCPLSIGKTQTATTPTNTERLTSMNIRSYNRFDGLMDELTIHPALLSSDAVAKSFEGAKPVILQPLKFREMPSGPSGPSAFGAFYTKLKYSPGWDALWRGSDYPDIVVRFEASPVKFVFWRGTGYIPALVNEKGMWATDQSLEHYGTGECYEAMGDKQTRYSHVRMIENTPARVMIHWRYALAGIKHQLLPEDEWGWGDWVDEYWTIYPDGIAARKQVLWSRRYEKDKKVMQWQETIFFCQPGTKPQDNVDMQALTFMDLEGTKQSYSWEAGPPTVKAFDKPRYQPVELVNFKSKYKPFNIFNEKRRCKPFSFGNMKEYTTIPNWNHWPVQQVASDGRNAVAPDKPSHASLTDSNGETQIAERQDDGSYWSGMLKGMTDGPIDSLLTLARSWNFPAPATSLSASASALYDKYSRAYTITVSNPTEKELAFVVQASASSPVYNLPLVISNWNIRSLRITCNNKVLKEGKNFVVGNVPELEGNKVIVFLKIKTAKPFTLRLNTQ